MFELITKEDNNYYGTFQNIKSLLKKIREILNDDFNFGIFMEGLKDENKKLDNIDYIIDYCDNWGFMIRVKGVNPTNQKEVIL